MGFWLALLVWAITLVSVVVLGRPGAVMPPSLSEAARGVDAQMGLTFVATGVAFVLAQGLLGWCVWRYRARAGVRARHFHGNVRVETSAAVVVGAVFLSLAVLGQRVWAQLHLAPGAPGALVVEVTGEQFAWNVRYPGPDGMFGRTDPGMYDPIANPLGLVAEDPAGRDDIVGLNVLAVPVGRPTEIRLGSKDVLHSFFVPALRMKQDTVPGMRIPLRFTATRTGEFEIPCAELCGLGHYRMKGTLRVLEPQDFEAWIAAQGPR